MRQQSNANAKGRHEDRGGGGEGGGRRGGGAYLATPVEEDEEVVVAATHKARRASAHGMHARALLCTHITPCPLHYGASSAS